MKVHWSVILCVAVLHFSSATLFGTKPLQLPKPEGIIDMITKPKLPVRGFQMGTHIGTGSFGFGFGFGIGGQGSQGAYVPPEERPKPSWGEEEEVDLEPEWGDNEEAGLPPTLEDGKKEKVDPRPDWEDDERKENPKSESLGETAKEKIPSWEDIGEEDERKSEDFMEGDLVSDGLILPRLDRHKRFIESRVYHVPLLFQSNGKPFKVKVRSNSNSLEKGNSGM